MICPSPPEDDFNVAIVVFIVLAALFFGMAGIGKPEKTPETPEASQPKL